jgi:RNA polymerase sigma-70 factor (ECF subfamily)
MAIKPEQFQASVQEWYDPLYRFAWSLCKDPDDANDLTQNAFYKLASKGDQIADPGKIKSWLFSVVHREFLDQYRRAKRFPQTSLELVAEPSARQNSAANRLDAETMMRAMGSLDEKFRAPLTLFYLQHFSYKEIASALELPMGTVMSRLRRAKDQLRELLESGSAGDCEQEPSQKLTPFDKKESRHG